MSSYKCISNFGQGVNNPSANPLTYCMTSGLDSEFNNGATGETIAGAYSKNCQAFMSSYCAENWNGLCEAKSKDRTTMYPNNLQKCDNNSPIDCQTLTAGEILIANTAAKKYIVDTAGTCNIKYEPFDPTVAGSPLISLWEGGGCVPIYAVDPSTIDSDPLMHKILDKPIIAWSILVNIYNTATRKNTLQNLKGTRIYNFFQSQLFQNYMQQTRKNSHYF